MVRRVNAVNNEVEMADRRKRKYIFHIKMLRQWYRPYALSLLTEETTGGVDGDIDEDVVLWDSGRGTTDIPTINKDLTADQQVDICQLLLEFQDVLPNKPGRTNSTEYRIRTSATLVRLPLYRLPHAYRNTVKKELENMEHDGIIGQSESEWAFQIVLIWKKDGTL